MKIVVVEWTDTTGHSDWVCREDALRQDIVHMTSVGFLVQNTKDMVQIAQTVGVGDDTMSNTLLIPKRCVSSIK